MDGDTMILFRSTFTDKSPISILLFKVQTGRIGNENQGDDPSGETKPTYDPEPGVIIDIVVNDRREECTEFTCRGGKTVCGGSDGNGKDFGSEEESGTTASVSPDLMQTVGEPRTLVQTAGKTMTSSRWFGNREYGRWYHQHEVQNMMEEIHTVIRAA